MIKDILALISLIGIILSIGYMGGIIDKMVVLEATLKMLVIPFIIFLACAVTLIILLKDDTEMTL